MRCGVYGKLPAKRDFVAIATSREFLGLWEPWVQGGISASRLTLGGDWQGVFLQAPIWRFWLGAGLSGATIAGAFMPSVDGVGRYFPLTVFAMAEADEAIPPPELDAQEGWFDAIETFLLSALEDRANFDAFTEALAGLPHPLAAPPVPVDGARRIAADTVLVSADPAKLGDALAAARVLNHASAYGAASFWWTLGGGSFAPVALAGTKMPSPHLFAHMLTGRFDGISI